jgi:hypothetical protein
MKLAEAIAAAGVELVKKNKIIILAVVVALLMATQAAAMASNRGATRRLYSFMLCHY